MGWLGCAAKAPIQSPCGPVACGKELQAITLRRCASARLMSQRLRAWQAAARSEAGTGRPRPCFECFSFVRLKPIARPRPNRPRSRLLFWIPGVSDALRCRYSGCALLQCSPRTEAKSLPEVKQLFDLGR